MGLYTEGLIFGILRRVILVLVASITHVLLVISIRKRKH